MATINKDDFRKSLIALSKTYTAQADMEFDEHGKVIKKKTLPGNDLGLADTVVVDQDAPPPDPTTLFDVGEKPKTGRKGKKRPKTKRAKKTRTKPAGKPKARKQKR